MQRTFAVLHFHVSVSTICFHGTVLKKKVIVRKRNVLIFFTASVCNISHSKKN